MAWFWTAVDVLPGTGVSCTKVLHLFKEAQIFDNLFVAHTIIEPLYDRRHHQHIYSSPK